MVAQSHRKFRVPTRSSSTTSNKPPANPWADQEVIKRSPFEMATDWLVNAHSPKGLMVLGWSALLSSQVLNAGFWISVCAGAGAIQTIMAALSPSLMAVGAVLAGLGISFGSSLFQGYPIVQSRAKDNIFSELMAFAFKPKTSSIPGGVDPDREHDYNNATTRFNRFMRKMGKFSTIGEIIAGILFMGAIFGGGLGALLSLGVFGFSIVGSQIGLAMIVNARNVALDSHGRHAVRKLESKARSEVLKAIR
jgi:hypothetical protein